MLSPFTLPGMTKKDFPSSQKYDIKQKYDEDEENVNQVVLFD